MKPISILLAFLLSVMTVEQAAAEPVDLELVLLADASRSIDAKEIAFQRQGYASAITSERILGAIRGGRNGRIALTYVEWGDAASQDVVVPWRIVSDAASAEAFVAALTAAPRRARGPNSIGNAIAAAHRLIETNAFEGERKVIDFSGDSVFSAGGIPIVIARQAALDDGITINALAILCRDCSGRPGGYDLEREYADRIIGGPGAFVITADGRQRFLDAVSNKMFREISAAPPGRIDAAGRFLDRQD
jgi:hypothetical protein